MRRAPAALLIAILVALIAFSAPAQTKLKVIALVALLVALAIGFALGRYRTYLFQNRGEARLSRAMQQRFGAPDYHLLNHVTLRLKEATTQIDHVLVSRFGIFVIETKDYGGWIFARSDDRYWTQVLYRGKFRFQNPIRQNYKHAQGIRELLEFLPADAIRPVVVFTGNAEFKTPVPDGVFSLAGFLTYVESQGVEVMSINRLQFCVGRLETARFQLPRKLTLSMFSDSGADMVAMNRAGGFGGTWPDTSLIKP